MVQIQIVDQALKFQKYFHRFSSYMVKVIILDAGSQKCLQSSKNTPYTFILRSTGLAYSG